MLFEKSDNSSIPLAVPLMYLSRKDTRLKDNLLRTYLSMSEEELDFKLSLEIEELRDDYNDYRKLVEAMYKLNPPSFLKEKFKQLPDFRVYKQEMEEEFDEDHKHLKDKKQYKALKITELYQSYKNHWRMGLSELIDYINRYTDFFFESLEGQERK